MLEMVFAKTEIVVRNGVGAVSPTLTVQEEHVVVETEEMVCVKILLFAVLNLVTVDPVMNIVDAQPPELGLHLHSLLNHLQLCHQCQVRPCHPSPLLQ